MAQIKDELFPMFGIPREYKIDAWEKMRKKGLRKKKRMSLQIGGIT